MALLDFLGSTNGRWVRGVVGVVLLVLAFLMGGPWGWVLGALGVVFVTVGVLDVCLLAPLVGRPLRGRDFRTESR
jgi:predicted phage tail protein